MTETTENPQQPTSKSNTEAAQQTKKANSEAARFRLKLRETEQERDDLRAERDALQEQINQGRTEEVHTALRAELSPSLAEATADVIVETADVEQFRAEDGTINDEAVKEYVSQFQPAPDRRGFGTYSSGDDRGAPVPKPTGWKGVLGK